MECVSLCPFVCGPDLMAPAGKLVRLRVRSIVAVSCDGPARPGRSPVHNRRLPRPRQRSNRFDHTRSKLFGRWDGGASRLPTDTTLCTISLPQYAVTPWVQGLGIQNSMISAACVAFVLFGTFLPMVFLGKPTRIATKDRYEKIRVGSTGN